MFKQRVKRPDVITGLVSLHQAYEGILVLGGIGAGKTSGPGREIRLNLLRLGAGIYVMCAKPGEAEECMRDARRMGRSGDVIRWGPGGGYYFPFLDYELKRPGGGVMSAGAVMGDIMGAVQASSGRSNDPFWQLSSERLIGNSIAGLWLGTGGCDVGLLNDYINSLPNSAEQFKSDQWQQNAVSNLCLAAALARGHKDDPDFRLARDFVLECATMSDKTFSGIKAQAKTVIEPFLTSQVLPLISPTPGWKAIAIPELVMEGKIVIADSPILTMREAGRLVQLTGKACVQRGVLARKIEPEMRDVCLFSDEDNWFCIAGIDALAQSVARQSRFINVRLAHNVELLQRALGGDNAKTDLGGWMANFQTQIFCQNSCPSTNSYASNLCGQRLQITMGGGGGTQKFDLVKDWMGQHEHGNNWHEHLMPNVRPEEFTRLKKGGKANGYRVEAIVYQGGESGKGYVRTTFNQRI